MDWKEGATVGAEISASGGFLWLVFRFLVGAAVADSLKDISRLNERMEAIARAQQTHEIKLDNLMLMLAERHT